MVLEALSRWAMLTPDAIALLAPERQAMICGELARLWNEAQR